MQVSQALEILGATRVIWIDDRFNNTPAQLASQLTNGLEISLACYFPELQEQLEKYEYDPAGTLQEVTQILADLDSARVDEIRTAFFERERASEGFATNELSADAISDVCRLLGIKEEDRWTFDIADKKLRELCSSGDDKLGYVVDLNESGGSSTRGLDMLQILWQEKSKGTAFILTHETDVNGEAKKEEHLRQELKDLGGLGLPVCVISKERLLDKAGDEEGLSEQLKIGVKRAGLRRSMHHVLDRARDRLRDAIDSAALSLLIVPPEQLESHVFERGYKEGVSELHVVERAIAAHLGKEARAFFGADDEVRKSVERLRALGAITLQKQLRATEPNLAAFREAEVWESDELLNSALTPIACGDVFELDRDEPATKDSTKKFVLLGQPCDISLRPNDRERQQDTAFLVPLKIKGKPSLKEPLLPFTLNQEQWACDFRNASVARLAVLDLASFRTDGRVRIDDGHTAPADLLVAQQNVYQGRTKVVTAALADPHLRPQNGQVVVDLQLTFSSAEVFKHIRSPAFEEAKTERVNKQTVSRPKRATWRLRRCGRIRMPYAAALLAQYSSVLSRQAFDVDFMSIEEVKAGPEMPIAEDW